MEHAECAPLADYEVLRFKDGRKSAVEDVLAREESLEVRLNDQTIVYLMRLPGDDLILAAGFCLSEGLIQRRKDIDLIRYCPDGDANTVEIKATLAAGARRFSAARVVRTGCGGADLAEEIDLESINVESDTVFPLKAIESAPELLLKGQEIFQATGGTHGACAFDSTGRAIVVKEDVGRHNAVDKVLGHLFLSGEPTADKGLMLSGRLSYEMVLKGARAGVPLICSVSAPTALGVEVARQTGITTVGFLRGSSFNVYSSPERIGQARTEAPAD